MLNRRRLVKFWRLPAADKGLLIEAALLLPVARTVIQWVPIRWYAPLLLGRHMADLPHGETAADEDLLRRVAWAARVVSEVMPWRNKCFALALTVKWMLARRGIASVLYLGARTLENRGFCAHAWLRCGNLYLTGGDGRNLGMVASFV
jgi:hypothetical protein